MRSRWMAVLLGVGLAAASQLPAAAGPVVMRVATPTTNDPQVYEMQLFKKAVEESSRGQIQVQLFPSSQLGSNAQMLQMLRAGSIQGLLEPTAFLGGFDNVMTVVDLPYLFRDVQQAVAILNGPLGNPLREHLERTGLVALGFYEYGPRIMLLKFPVRTLEDLRGKKIRVMGAQVLVDQMNAWGATGIAMGVPELFNALQQGTIDGLESAAMFFYSGRYHELARYLFMAPRGAEVTVFLSNKRWLDGLPDELRRVVLAAGAGITEEANRFARQSDAQALENMQKAGVTVLEPSPALDGELRARARAVHEKFLRDNPEARPIYEALRKAAEQ
ncbi:MAG TPA: TRAP transporter substrate-binding protein [Limnochordales bacterium]